MIAIAAENIVNIIVNVRGYTPALVSASISRYHYTYYCIAFSFLLLVVTTCINSISIKLPISTLLLVHFNTSFIIDTDITTFFTAFTL